MDDDAKLDMIKLVTDLAVGGGVLTIVSGVVNNNVPKGGMISNVCVFSAKFTAASMMSDILKKYTDEKIDNAAKWWKENVDAERST